MNDTTSSDSGHANLPPPSFQPASSALPDARRVRRFGLTTVIWLLLLGFLVYLQWPMLKGTYYKTTDAAAPASAIGWRTNFDAALAESAQSGKPVLVDFTADWCPPCKVMKHDVWPDADVAAAVNAGYIPLLLDVDQPANAPVADRYGVRAIPTILVMNAQGEVLHAGMFMDRGKMLEFLKQGV